MSKKDTRIVILGAGPAGVGAAFQLAKQGYSQVTVLERHTVVGGNAGSFELAGMMVDFGSHRLHPACEPEVFQDIQLLLGPDLLNRPRHGRIRLQGRWVHFPLKPQDLLLKLPVPFAIGVIQDLFQKTFRRRNQNEQKETFATILEAGLGTTICRDFYFPYARKLWGVEPEELAVTQAKRRVGASSLGKMIRKVASAVPGFKPPGAGRFYYPRKGFGQITEAMYHEAEKKGVTFLFGAQVQSLRRNEKVIQQVCFEQEGKTKSLDCDQVWSTLPITAILRGLDPSLHADVQQAIQGLEYRAMLLVYLVLEQEQFTEFDAHYFPESEIRISRLSEPKNYSLNGPAGLTVLCAELPCSQSDEVWNMDDQALGELVRQALEAAGLPGNVPLKEVFVRRLPHAYPIYRQGYEEKFHTLDTSLDDFANLLSFGRQGLFAHDNTHHALFMAYSAVKCLQEDGKFDWDRWREFRRVFETHVVED